MKRALLLACAATMLCLAQEARAQLSPAAQRGLTFVRAHCAGCHSIDKVSESPLAIAPPFRNLHRKYPVETLAGPLSEGIRAKHPTMPQFRLDSDQIADVITFLKTLEQDSGLSTVRAGIVIEPALRMHGLLVAVFRSLTRSPAEQP